MPLQYNLPDPETIDKTFPTDLDVLLYGGGKTGKTLFAASFAHEGPVLMLDTGKGSLSLRTNPLIITDELRSEVYVQSIPRYDHRAQRPVPIGWSICEEIMDQLEKTGSFGPVAPRTLILDEATAASEMALQSVLHTTGHIDAAQVTQPEWGQLRKRTLSFITRGRGLKGINFIFIAHEQYLKDELSGHTCCLPSMIGKLAHEISGYFDEVYHTKVRQMGQRHEYIMDTKPTGVITAGSRLNLPTPMDTSYGSLRKAIDKVTGVVK